MKKLPAPTSANVTPTAPSAAPDRVALVLALLASVGVLLAIWGVDYFPTHDGPQHIFLGHVANHYADSGSSYDRYFVPGRPLTALGFHFLFTLAERFTRWQNALRFTLSVVVLVWGFGYLRLTTALHPRRAILGLLGFGWGISWAVYMGFLSYALSIGIGFFIVAFALRAPWTLTRRILLAALLLVQTVVHLFGVQLTGLTLAALVVAEALTLPPRTRLRALGRELGLLALMGLPAVAVALVTTSPATSDTRWLTLAERLTVLPRTFVSGPLVLAWTPILLAGLGLWWVATRARRGGAPRRDVALASMGALCLLLAFALPLHLASWEFFSPRFLPPGCLLAIALLPVERLTLGRQRAVRAGLVLVTAGSLGVTLHLRSSVRAALDEPLSGLGAPIHRTGPRLIASFNPFTGLGENTPDQGAHQSIPFMAPVLNLGSLYAVEQGGIPPYVFVKSPRLHAFVMSPEAQDRFPPLFDQRDLYDPKVSADPGTHRAYLSFLAALGVPFEDLVLWGTPEDGDALVERGYRVNFRRGGLFMGHFGGCPVELAFHTLSPRREAIFVEYGFVPMPQALNQAVLPPDPPGSGRNGPSTKTLTPETSLCGPVWLRASLDLDLSGSPSPADRLCKGADRHGRLRVTATPGVVIGCDLTP
jgi:hypothetical protein